VEAEDAAAGRAAGHGAGAAASAQRHRFDAVRLGGCQVISRALSLEPVPLKVTARTWVWFLVCSLDIQLDTESSIRLSYKNNSRF
jgi:hypothetical protein